MGQSACYIPVAPDELDRVRADPSLMNSLVERGRERGEEFTVEKTWDAIRYLIANGPKRDDPVLAEAILGGEALPESETGHMAPRYLVSGQVRAVAAALGRVSPADLRAAFDPARMNEEFVYPVAWDADRAEWEWNYIWQWFTALVEGFAKAAQEGKGLLTFLG
jgi:hypothetical protein